MINPIITAKIFSTLGNNTSLIPLGVKDVSNTLGMTAGSYVSGGNVEGKDRLIDECGAQVIWLLGIPFFKKIIDMTVYKAANFNSKIDVRMMKNEKILKKAIEHAPTKEIKESIERAAKNSKGFKGLAIGKFIAATALTMGSYATLTHFRHKHTEKALIKEIKEEKKQEDLAFKQKQKAEKLDKAKNIKPSFGSKMSALEQFMFDPVKNTMIVDGGISSERLAESRNPQDFIGYVVKEGGFWAFMYFLGPAIQKHFEKKAAKQNKPIDLDIRVLQDENLKKAFADKSIEKQLADLPKEFLEYQKNAPTKGDSKAVLQAKEAARKELEPKIYESLFEKGDNLIVKMMKESEIVKTIKVGTEQKIDTQSFINIEDVVGTKEKVQKLYKEYSSQSKQGLDDFFKGVLKLKRASIIKNIGVSVGALGLLVPGIMVAMRFMGEGNKEFQVKKEIKEKLEKSGKLA